MKTNCSRKLKLFLTNISYLFVVIVYFFSPLKAVNEVNNVNENLITNAPISAKNDPALYLNLLEFPKDVLEHIINFAKNRKNLARSSPSLFFKITNYYFDYTFYNSCQYSEIKKFLENQEQNAYKHHIHKACFNSNKILINLPLDNQQLRNSAINFSVFWLFQETKLFGIPNWALNLLNYSRVQHLELREELNKNQLQLIADHTTLTSLDASDIKIDDENIKILSRNVRFRYLNLARNSITSLGIRNLANIKMLNSLDLSNITINGSIQFLAKIMMLGYLNLSNTKINHTDIRELSNIKILNHLDLSDNNISNDMVQDLANIMTITYLNLSHNNVGFLGAQYLSKMINLIDLNLKCNSVGDSGAKYLAESKSITLLDLERNRIHNSGAKALANMANLVSLRLGFNYVGNVGAKALAESTNLTSLYLNNNKVHNGGAQALENNNKLIRLDLSNNNLDNSKVQALAASL